MIVVTVALHSARTGEETVLGRTIIHNVGGTHERGEYEVCVGNKRDRSPQRRGKVHDYPRLAYNVWRLVIRGLLDAFPEEKNK